MQTIPKLAGPTTASTFVFPIAFIVELLTGITVAPIAATAPTNGALTGVVFVSPVYNNIYIPCI